MRIQIEQHTLQGARRIDPQLLQERSAIVFENPHLLGASKAFAHQFVALGIRLNREDRPTVIRQRLCRLPQISPCLDTSLNLQLLQNGLDDRSSSDLAIERS